MQATKRQVFQAYACLAMIISFTLTMGVIGFVSSLGLTLLLIHKS